MLDAHTLEVLGLAPDTSPKIQEILVGILEQPVDTSPSENGMIHHGPFIRTVVSSGSLVSGEIE